VLETELLPDLEDRERARVARPVLMAEKPKNPEGFASESRFDI